MVLGRAPTRFELPPTFNAPSQGVARSRFPTLVSNLILSSLQAFGGLAMSQVKAISAVVSGKLQQRFLQGKIPSMFQ